MESVETALCPYISMVYKFQIFHVFHTFEKKIHFMRVFDTRFHTFAPKFCKIDIKNFCKCHFMRVFDTLFHTFGLQKMWLFYDLATLLP